MAKTTRSKTRTPADSTIAAPPYGAVAHGLSDEQFHQGGVCTTAWVADAKYAYDRGVAMTRYLAALKEGRIIGVRCEACGRTMVPPRAFCEQCFRPVDDWVDIKDTGTINTFSLCYVTWDVRRTKEPQIPAVIEIDGASPGMGIMHLIGGVDPKKVHRGMRVKAVWKPQAEREGAITDILYWKPA